MIFYGHTTHKDWMCEMKRFDLKYADNMAFHETVEYYFCGLSMARFVLICIVVQNKKPFQKIGGWDEIHTGDVKIVWQQQKQKPNYSDIFVEKKKNEKKWKEKMK